MKKSIIKTNAFEDMDVSKIVFLGECNEIPSYAQDFSQDNNGSVVGWKNDSNVLYIASTCADKIIANEDSSFMFFNCINLRHIDGLKHLDTSMVRDMACMFSWCEKLEELDLSSFDTHNVVDMGEMFAYCFNLKELNVSKFNTSKVKNMSYMFRNCWNLTNADLSNFNTENVQSMEQMFYCCDALQKLDISNFNFSNIIDMSYMLKNCKSLMHLSLPNMKYEDVQNMIVGLDSKLCWECKAE